MREIWCAYFYTSMCVLTVDKITEQFPKNLGKGSEKLKCVILDQGIIIKNVF